MKTIVICLATIISLVGCSLFERKGGGKDRRVQISEGCIMIPGTMISTADQEKIRTILRKYKKWPEIYRIQPYQKGRPGEPIGTLKVAKATADEVAKYATHSGLTSWTTQIGLCHPVGWGCSPATGGAVCLGSENLVREVTPILRKYQ